MLTEIIKEIFIIGRSNYGVRRIKRDLDRNNIKVSRHRINRLMKDANLICKTKRKFKATTNSRHNYAVSPNLPERNFTVTAPNKVWVGDITYIPTAEGWFYLATVIDLHSRQVIGWSMSNRINADLANNALLMAIWKRKPIRRNINYFEARHIDIKPLVPLLPFIKNKNSWGYVFRYGFLEIDQESFEIIVHHMLGFNPLLSNQNV